MITSVDGFEMFAFDNGKGRSVALPVRMGT